MAGSIKGITIEILGKTDGLVKSLGNVNKSLAETQKSLKTVNQALKLDPKNVDALKTKQEILSTAIQQTGEKLKLEKKAAEEAAKALEEGTITKNQYDTLQAEVSKTTAELRNLESQATDTNRQIKDLGGSSKMSDFTTSLDKAADKLKSIGENITKVGEGLTKTATLAVAGFGVASYKAYTDVDDALDTVALKTGATGEALEDMEDRARSIATSIPTSFETASAAVGEVSTKFGNTGDDLEGLSEKFVKFAQLNKTDVSNSVDNVKKALTAFGKDGKSAGSLLDVLNRTAQNTGVSVDKLEQGLVQNATAFDEMGLSIEQSVQFMGQLEKSGASSDTVLQGMRRALKSATADGKSMSEALDELQNNIVNGTDSVDGLTYAYDLFGKSGDQIYGALKNGSLDFKDVANSASILADSTNSVDETYKNLEDGSGALKVAQNNLKDSLSQVGQTLGETLAPIITKVSRKLKEFGQWWESLDESQRKVILTIAGLVAILGPLLIVIGKISTGVSAVITVITTVTGAIGGATATTSVFGITMSSTLAPLAAVVAAITAIIVVIKNWDAIVEAAQLLWEGFCTSMQNIIDTITQAWEAFNEFITGLIEAFVEFWSEKWEGIKQFFSDIWDGIKEIASQAWEAITGFFAGIGEWFGEKFQAAYDKVCEIFGALGEFFSGVWDDIVEIFSEIGTSVGEAISGAVRKVINVVLSGAINIINGFISAINLAIKAINLIPGVHVSKIKKLEMVQMEKGGILKKGEIGLLEGNGAEAVVPLDQNKKWVDAVAQSMQSSLAMTQPQVDYRPQLNQIIAAMQSGATITINQQLNGQTFDRQVIQSINRYNYRTGGR